MRSFFVCIALFFTTVSFSQNGVEETVTPVENELNNSEPQVQEESVQPKEEKGLKKNKSKSTSLKSSQYRKADKNNQQPTIRSSQSLESDFNDIRIGAQSSTTRTVNVVAQRKMDAVVSDLERSDATSFEYHKIKYVNSHHNATLFNHLEAAYYMNPKDQQVLELMISYYDANGDVFNRRKKCQELKSIKPYAAETYEYLKNVLKSVPLNGVLVTHGSLDTYPLFILKDVEGFRKDVTIISLDLLQSKKFREKLKALNFRLPQGQVIDTKYLKSFCELNKQKNIHLSLTIPKNYFKEMPSSIFITGLAFKYSKNSVQNILDLKRNWEKFDKNIFENERKPKNESVKLISNYLLPMIVLKRQYEKETLFGASEALGAYIQKVSRWQQQEQQVQDILKK